MQGSTDWRLVLGVVAGLAGPPAARAQNFPAVLKGQWTGQGGDCNKTFAIELSGNTLRLRSRTRHAFTERERVMARRATGFTTRVVRSDLGIRLGARLAYEMLAPGQLRVTNTAGRDVHILVRCPDPLPAGIAPRPLVEAVYARYASAAQLGTPFESLAMLHQFLVPELADHYTSSIHLVGPRPHGCKGDYDPFVPDVSDGLSMDDQDKGSDEVQAGKASVSAPPVPPDATTATVHVSVGDLGKPGEITVVLNRTPAGWRISDVIPASRLSFRADMVACAAPQPKPAAP